MCGLHPTLTAAEPQETKALLSPPVQLAAIAAIAIYLHSICWWMRPPDMGIFLEPWFAQGLTPRAYVYTDRPAYRPGSDVEIRGVVREVAITSSPSPADGDCPGEP